MTSIDDKKIKLAKKLGMVVTPETTEDQLDTFIKESEAKDALEKEQAKIAAANVKKATEEAKKAKIILKDVDGEDVDQKDYFFHNEKTGETDTAPVYFNKVCGYPVDREDLIEVFNSVFPKNKGFLFNKLRDKELYLIIVPIKYATTISKNNESLPGDFQKHALSFIGEGSVNIDSLKLKLAKVANHPSIRKEPLA